MRRSWPILILGLALAGALVWGYTQNRQRSQLALRARNTYQQSFHRLDDMAVNLEDALARLLATNSPMDQRNLLADLRVTSAQAVENLAGLPLIHVPLERTAYFLNNLRESVDDASFVLNHGGSLNASQWTQVRQLYQQAKVFKSEIGNLLPTVAHGDIGWFDTERATAYTVDGTRQTLLTTAVTRLDGKLQQPGAEDEAPPVEKPKGDLGPAVSVEQAINNASRFLDLPPVARPQLSNRIDGPFPLYVVNATKSNKVPVSIGVSVQGGHVIWMLDGRDIPQAVLSREQVVQRAQQFLNKNGLTGFKERFYDEYDEAGALAVVTLVPVRDGITYFNEWVKVRVARDNGEILGYDATQYWVNKHDRPVQKPKLEPSEAAARVNPQVNVSSVELGVTDIFEGHEALVYLVRAILDDNEYDIFINAMTGEEEKVERVEKAGGPNRAR